MSNKISFNNKLFANLIKVSIYVNIILDFIYKNVVWSNIYIIFKKLLTVLFIIQCVGIWKNLILFETSVKIKWILEKIIKNSKLMLT